ncbi:EAL and HDOD domain-containing protein [Noviherbaspirillum sp. ST9]|uniref:EAL and HDOD domain-containing protein n=1 Tax=Noviherbaspirillum sp. ST9 TaxID=3401606 RepID=UPI003B58A6EA
MSALNPVPLLSVEVLADRNRTPAALLLDLSPYSTEAFTPLVQAEDFRALASRFPCLVPAARLEPTLEQALLDAGCRIVPDASIVRLAALPEEALPSEVEWIAGPWYMAPRAKPAGSQAASRALALQLVQLVSADADTHEIEAVLRRDPALSYHLLRLVNSLGMGMSRQVTSFSQAILILGRAQLRRWLNLMLFSARSGDEGSAMLLTRVASRARLMELLAKASGLDKPGQESAFMAGMFSLLGILFGMPLEEVLRPLKISESLQSALLHRDGEVGRLLALVESAEQAEHAVIASYLHALSLPAAEFNLLTVQAHAWMLDVVRESAGGTHA